MKTYVPKNIDDKNYNELLINVSKYLNNIFKKGFSTDNLENMRKFYLCYGKSETVSRKCFSLSWSHYVRLMRIKNIEERKFYEIEAIENNIFY